MSEEILNIAPRKYQEKIYNTCKEKNCLVVLPTGTGKTLIALMLAINRQKAFPGSKCLFLAPTRPLAEQHLEYFKKNLPELFCQLDLFTGKVDAEKRKKIWQRADIIFATPQTIANDLKKNLYSLEDVSLLIEDECHRCLKNYAYTYVASEYKKQAKNIRILGLTASPGTERKTIEKVAENLGIEALEVRTKDSEDVKEYIQKTEFELHSLEFPEEFSDIKKLLDKIFSKKVEELKSRKLLFKPSTKTFLLELQRNIMRAISSGNKNFNLLSGAGACATAIKIQHALELLETQTLHSLKNYMLELFSQASQQKSKAVQHLVKTPEFNQAFVLLNELLAKKIENPKIEELKKIIKEEFTQNANAKFIVFSQFRDSVSKISQELNNIQGIKSKTFVGQAKKGEKGKETGLSQKDQQKILNEFKNNELNVIVCTSIAEEGLDIPEVNAVIFYEPIPSAIRKIQRGGRTGRLTEGKLIILMLKGTRDEAYYWSAFHKEKRMYKALDSIKRDMEIQNLQKENNQKTLF